MSTPFHYETSIQTAIMEFLSYQENVFMWRNNNTGVFDPVRKVYLKPRSKHAIKGVSDILGVYKDKNGIGRILCIEVKSKKGKISKEQIEFLERINKMGGIGFVARSVTDVVNQFMKLK